MKKARFDIRDLLPIGLVMIVAGIGIAYGLSVLGDVRDDFVTGGANCSGTDVTGCAAEYNASVDSIDGVSKIPEKLPLIATVIVAAVIIGILVRYLMVRFS